MSCHLYGYHAVVHLKVLIGSGGNQCPLIIDALSPCVMEMEHKEPDWLNCPRNRAKDPLVKALDGFKRVKMT